MSEVIDESRRRKGVWLLLAFVVVAAIVWAAWPSGGDRSVDQRVHDIAAQLRCPECSDVIPISDLSTETARAIKRDIRRQVLAGKSDDQILQSYVDRYKESILLQPQGGGIGFLVWGLPVVALVLGAGGLFFALRRWRGQPVLHATSADEALVERARRS